MSKRGKSVGTPIADKTFLKSRRANPKEKKEKRYEWISHREKKEMQMVSKYKKTPMIYNWNLKELMKKITFSLFRMPNKGVGVWYWEYIMFPREQRKEHSPTLQVGVGWLKAFGRLIWRNPQNLKMNVTYEQHLDLKSFNSGKPSLTGKILMNARKSR